MNPVARRGGAVAAGPTGPGRGSSGREAEHRGPLHRLVVQLSVALAYAGLSWVTLHLQLGSLPIVWLPTGLAVAALLRGGTPLALGITAGTLITSACLGRGPGEALVVATAVVGQALLAAELCRRAGLRTTLERSRDVVILVLAAGVAACACGAIVATLGRAALGLVAPDEMLVAGRIWGLSGLLGVLVVTPLILVAERLPACLRDASSQLHAAALIVGAAGSSVFAVSPLGQTYLTFPAILVAAMRFRLPGAVVGSVIVTAVTAYATSRGFGPFIRTGDQSDIPFLQGFVCILTLAALMLGALTAERTEAQLQLLNSEAERIALSVEREAEQRFRRAFEDAPIGMALMSFQGHLLRVNGTLCEIAGRPEHELVGRTIQSFAHPDDGEAGAGDIAATLMSGEMRAHETERRMVRGDGSVAWVLLSSSLVNDESGRPAYVITHVLDITERRLVEAELARSTDELRRSNEELERFAYVASHDLTEPLRTMSGFATLLRDRYEERLDDRGRRYLGHVVDGAGRMQALIDGLLEYSRAGRRRPDFAPVQTEELAHEILGELAASVRERDAHVTIGDLPPVMGDRMLLRQVLQNLLANALKFGGDAPPQVTVTAQADRRLTRISVADNGIGIEPRHTDRIFEMFQRLHTREQYEGTGIGLALAKRIVELHGGRIWVDSQPGAGTTFSFTLASAPAPPPVPVTS